MRYSQSNIQTGWNVYDSSGEKIGSVNELFDERFVMNTGLFGLGTQYGIPYDAISRVDGDRIYLNTTRDHLSDFLDNAERSERTLTGTRGGSTRFEDDERLRRDDRTFEDRERNLTGKRTDLGREEERSIPLREEELEVHRRNEQAGEVTISKDVEEERRRMDVPVSEERVYVERRPASGREASGPIGEDETISVPIREEQIDVDKRTVVREELGIGKDSVTRNKQVEETLRREVPRVEKSGEIRRLDNETDEEFRERRLRDKRNK